MRKSIVHAILVLVAGALSAGEVINLNSSMELGLTGAGVPACRLDVNRAAISAVRANPEKVYFARTVPGGNPGQCLMIPGYTGVSNYQLELADFLLTRDGEVEISFDAKIGPDETGAMQPQRSFHIDFRTFPDLSRDTYYPMLTGFSFRPGTEWKRFSRRFKVKAYTNYYHIWVLPNGIPDGGTGNALYLDNFRFAWVDGKPAEEPEEYAVIPDRTDQIYAPGDPVKLTVRARLRSDRKELAGTLKLRREYDNSPFATLPVTLRADADGTFEGSVTLKAGEYGSFLTGLEIPGKTLRGVNSSFVVLHPVIRHPWGSPGWGIGANAPALCPFGRAGKECVDNYILPFAGMERAYRLFRQAGVQMLRIWGHWRQIEPEEGKFTADIMDLPMKEIARYGYEPIFCLVGNFIIHGGRQGLERRLKRGNSNLPEYLFQWYHQSSDPGKGSVLPPIEVYGRYLDFVLAHWGKQVRIWEVSNEPGIFGMPAKNYIDYLKYTNRTVKARRPDAVILGNGVTGDFGINVVKWCEQLNEADPNYVESLDGIAFHPYASGLDYLNGIRGLYGQCVENIRGKLARPRPLWNTECYYLPAARFRQINHGREFSRYGANDIQRHFLDGLYHGVMAAAAPDPASYFHRAGNTVNLISFNQVAAAQNALSALLDGMMKLEKVELNPQVRSALFLSGDGKRALGFLYDFRPSGSTWIPGRADGVKILDLYGNDRTAAGKYHLGFEPCYLAGTPDAVRKALTGSRFELENPVEFHGRKFGNLLLLDAKNLSGLPGEMECVLGGMPLHLSFRNDVGHTVAALPFSGKIPAGVKMVPETPGYTLPATVKLSGGTRAALSVSNGMLKIQLEVKDSNLKAADGKNLWNGSAVEVFLDPEPLRNLSIDDVKPHQYVFAALPSSTGVETIAVRRETTRAARKVERTATGYRMTLEIPLDELPDSEFYGIDIEIDRPGEKEKESLGSRPGLSFRKRLHYHLIRIPREQKLHNTDFSDASYGDPAWWCYSITPGMTVTADGKNGVVITNHRPDKVAESVIQQQIPIPPGKYRSGTLQVVLRYRDVKAAKPGRGRRGLLIAVNYNGGNLHYAETTRKQDLEGDGARQLRTFDFKIPPRATYLALRIGLGAHTTGTVQVERAELMLNQ